MPGRRPRVVQVHQPGDGPRGQIDYALARRAVLAALEAGRTFREDACDADPYLLRAARHHGEVTDRRCPVCRHDDPLTHVTFVFGDGLGEASGRACASRDFTALAATYGELTAYVVEVCERCRWNHLVSSASYGRPLPQRPRRRRAAP